MSKPSAHTQNVLQLRLNVLVGVYIQSESSTPVLRIERVLIQ